MKKLSLLSLLIISILLSGCSKETIFDNLPEDEMKGGIEGNKITFVASLPGNDVADTSETRVAPEQNVLNLDLTWQDGDNVELCFEYEVDEGGSKVIKTERQVSKVTVNPENKRRATFTVELPDGDYTTFNLYGVFGGGGLDPSDPHKALLPAADKMTGSLEDIQDNHAIMLMFEKKEINKDDPDFGISFKHLGTLINILLKNDPLATNSVTVKKMELRSTSEATIGAHINSGTGRYDFTTGEFTGTSFATGLPFELLKATELDAGGTVEFWGWYPPAVGDFWPELKLTLIGDSETELATTKESKPERASEIEAGNAYHFFANYKDGVLSFSSVIQGKFTDHRDGTVYKTTQIGNQIWMAENLKWLPSVSSPENESSEIAYYYVYDYWSNDVDEAKATDNYKGLKGVLYNWPAAQTACPEGWYLPSKADWDELITSVGGGTNAAGKKLKSNNPNDWDLYNRKEATDEYGFSAVGGGYRGESPYYFYNTIYDGYWWTTTLTSGKYYTSKYMYNNGDFVREDDKGAIYGLSVRCVRN